MNNLKKIKSMPVEQLARLMVYLVIKPEFTTMTGDYYCYWTFKGFDGHEIVSCSTEEQAIHSCIEWLNNKE